MMTTTSSKLNHPIDTTFTLDPNHLLIHLMNFIKDVLDFMIDGSWFHIFGIILLNTCRHRQYL